MTARRGNILGILGVSSGFLASLLAVGFSPATLAQFGAVAGIGGHLIYNRYKKKNAHKLSKDATSLKKNIKELQDKGHLEGVTLKDNVEYSATKVEELVKI